MHAERTGVGDQGTDTELDKTPAGALPSPAQEPIPHVGEDVDVDERETDDPSSYWRAVRTRGRIDLDVGTGWLKPREGAFVIEYTLSPGDATAAAVRAGYSPNGAHVQAQRLLRRERVQTAIAREFAAKAATAGVDRDYLVRQCRDIAEDHSCKTADRLRAIELMGKLLGEFAAEKVEHTHTGLAWADVVAEQAEDAQVIDPSALPAPPGDCNPV